MAVNVSELGLLSRLVFPGLTDSACLVPIYVMAKSFFKNSHIAKVMFSKKCLYDQSAVAGFAA